MPGHVDPFPPRGERVAQLVQHDRGEEAGRRDDRDGVDRRRAGVERVRERVPEHEDHDEEHEEPRVVHADADPEHADQRKRAGAPHPSMVACR